jgi:RNA polymerase sigma-70 factor (ECF subfamily)
VDLSGVVQVTLAEVAAAPPPADDEHARRLIRAVFLNNLRDAVRHWRTGKRDVSREVPLDLGSGAVGDPFATLAALTTPSQRAVQREQEERLRAALVALPEDQRTAVTLHHLLGLSVGEVGDLMERTVPAVSGLLRRGLEQLGRLLRGGDGSSG